MSGSPRRDIVDPNEIGTYHCYNRCVRRAFLCGEDPYTGKNFNHRRDWVVRRQKLLARLFAVEIAFHAELKNHLHVVLRTRPDLVENWSDEEVIRRWLRITKLTRNFKDEIEEPSETRVREKLLDKNYVAEVRKRLSSISSFMGALCEYLARRANAEDGVTGKFWEDRFGCRRCMDEGAILVCGMYVDLNQVRAGEALTPETSTHTSAYDRIQARGQLLSAVDGAMAPNRMLADSWLAPLTLEQGPDVPAGMGVGSVTPWRASDRGLLSVSLEQYLELLDWTGRQQRGDKAGAIPAHLAPILERLGIRPDYWVGLVGNLDRWFARAVGNPESMARAAAHAAKSWTTIAKHG